VHAQTGELYVDWIVSSELNLHMYSTYVIIITKKRELTWSGRQRWRRCGGWPKLPLHFCFLLVYFWSFFSVSPCASAFSLCLLSLFFSFVLSSFVVRLSVVLPFLLVFFLFSVSQCYVLSLFTPLSLSRPSVQGGGGTGDEASWCSCVGWQFLSVSVSFASPVFPWFFLCSSLGYSSGFLSLVCVFGPLEVEQRKRKIKSTAASRYCYNSQFYEFWWITWFSFFFFNNNFILIYIYQYTLYYNFLHFHCIQSTLKEI
jgi:hypothetical protein